MILDTRDNNSYNFDLLLSNWLFAQLPSGTIAGGRDGVADFNILNQTYGLIEDIL